MKNIIKDMNAYNSVVRKKHVLTSIFSNIKKWNWTIFFIAVCVAEIGAISNKNIENIGLALFIGLLCGIVFGLPMAIMSKQD